MIEINLLPTAEKRKPRRGVGLRLPRAPSAPRLDRWTLAIAGAWIVGPALLGWLYLGSASRMDELAGAVESAEQDSVRYARLIESATALQSRRDTIAEKLQIIQQVDAGRYVWSHIMDEVARALPEYTWLTELSQTDAGPQPGFEVRGLTGTTFALTRYLDGLEASPFVREVRLEGTQRIEAEGRELYEFTVRARYEEPPVELVETVPVFAADEPVAPEPQEGRGTAGVPSAAAGG